MPQQTCPQCKTQFVAKRTSGKFCSDRCRYNFWLKNHTGPKEKFNEIEDIREAIAQSKKVFNKLHSHFSRVMEMYDDFETNLVKLDNKILALEENIPDATTELKEENSILKQDNEILLGEQSVLKAKIHQLNKDLIELVCDTEEESDIWQQLEEKK